jgi:hypothetical protein
MCCSISSGRVLSRSACLFLLFIFVGQKGPYVHAAARVGACLFLI